MSGKKSFRINLLVGYFITGIFAMLRLTFWLRVANDRRPTIVRTTGSHYVFAILHSHQLAAVTLSQWNTGAMVSRSNDGDKLIPLLRACGCKPIRGSSGVGGKGGATALTQMIRHIRDGNPGVIAVDGPRGPRGLVQPGAALVALKTMTPIVPVVLIPRRRWILSKTWDRMQIPKPFCRFNCLFADPIYPQKGETVESLTERVETALHALEMKMDPEEAKLGLELKTAQTEQVAARRAARRERTASLPSKTESPTHQSDSTQESVRRAA